MKPAMTTAEKMFESRRIIDYVSGLNMKDSVQREEAQIAMKMVNRLNAEVDEELKEVVKWHRRVYSYLRVYFLGHVKAAFAWTLFSLFSLYTIEFTVKLVIYLWLLVW